MADYTPHDLPLRKLYAWRKFRDMTQVELADEAGVSASTISLLENDQVDYSGDTLNRLTKALRCTADNLMFDEPPANADELAVAMQGLTEEQRSHLLGLVRTIKKP